MKRSGYVVAGLIAILISGCGNKNYQYSSILEAETACDEWKNKKTTVHYVRDQSYLEMKKDFELTDPKPKWSLRSSDANDAWHKRFKEYQESNQKKVKGKMDSRKCRPEEATKQFLGLEHDWDNEWLSGPLGRFRVVKNFRY